MILWHKLKSYDSSNSVYLKFKEPHTLGGGVKMLSKLHFKARISHRTHLESAFSFHRWGNWAEEGWAGKRVVNERGEETGKRAGGLGKWEGTFQIEEGCWRARGKLPSQVKWCGHSTWYLEGRRRAWRILAGAVNLNSAAARSRRCFVQWSKGRGFCL